MTALHDSRILVLHSDDNIAVAACELAAGTQVQIGAASLTVRERIDVGHKFALRMIQPGEKIMKYRAPIGSATRLIQAGEYVHTHNMQSDYLPTYTLA
ncbi:MAG: UxaA family hydrolase [Candidatus Competibacteraceae bacterium]|nr:UxaA family hydrolase [Candidatus Competibacteraceae bacterium]MCB1807222.1 UxaA family hydrolase [Candidatus Competibacteraceae bacterium]MCB1813669.1 UxaA family hydrolase [Candidatus Competibacteraceae bacterium]